MKPIKFPEHNVVFGKVPAFKEAGQPHKVVTCWKLSFRERMRLLFTGELWMSVMTFGDPIQPIYPTVEKHEVLFTIQATSTEDKATISV